MFVLIDINDAEHLSTTLKALSHSVSYMGPAARDGGMRNTSRNILPVMFSSRHRCTGIRDKIKQNYIRKIIGFS